MGISVVEKPHHGWTVVPNLVDYETARASFTWEAARRRLDGLQGERGLNIAHEAVDRHAAGARRDRSALVWRGRRGERRAVSYEELRAATSRFANVLEELGVQRGDRVFALAGRVSELYAAALGTLKHRAVFCPLFAAFGPEPVHQRLQIGEGRVLVTTAALYRRRVAEIRDRLPALEHVLLIGDPSEVAELPGTHDLARLLDAAGDAYEIGPTDPEDEALLHFTSGTTGTPKGAVHVHGAVVAHHATGALALDLHPDDVFWCTADPGWVTGTSYGIVAPLTHGVTMVVDEGEFDARRWYAILDEEGVNVWYTAPTAIRMMMKAGAALAQERDLSSLRFIASVGEPLHPTAVGWGEQAFGLPIHDNWWQTETGGIMIANYRAMDIRPGSMGRPMPGVEAAIVRRDERGRPVVDATGEPVLAADGEEGELALRTGWPSMFRGYLHDERRYYACFTGS